MASEDRNKEKGGPPDLHGTPFRWGAILTAIRDQIPSMDSDVSLADGEEDGELFLFQRDQSNLIPDLTEELKDLPPEESHLQETFSFMRHPWEIWNEDVGSSAFQHEKALPSESRGDLLVDTGLFRSPTEEQPNQHSSGFFMNEQQFGKGISRVITGKVWDLRREKDTPPSDTSPTIGISPLLMLDTSEKERRKLIETKILSKAPLRPPSDLGYPQAQNKNNLERMAEVKKEGAVVLAEHPQEMTLFRFKDIEKWDLDKILQKLEKQSKATSWPGEAGSPSISHETFRAVSQSRLMGKLEELSRKQSKTFSSRYQRCPPKLLYLDKCWGDARDMPVPAPLRNDLSQTPAALLCVPEPPTVYIDLRDTMSQKLEPLADEAQSLSDSSSDDEEDTKVTAQNKEEGRMNEFPQLSRKNCTGKCFLLQQLRNFRKRMSQMPAIAPDKRSQHLQKPDQTDLLNVRRRQSLKHRGQSLAMTGHLESNAENSLLIDCAKSAAKPGVFQKATKEETCSELPPDSSAKKDPKHSRTVENQQEKQVKEKSMKLRFQEQLERSKPQQSTSGKQPMAEQPPIMLHMVSSQGGSKEVPFHQGSCTGCS